MFAKPLAAVTARYWPPSPPAPVAQLLHEAVMSGVPKPIVIVRVLRPTALAWHDVIWTQSA